MKAKIEERLTKSESALWHKILMNHMQQKIRNSPDAAISDVYSDAYKDFLNEKWVCLVDGQKQFAFKEDEYQKFDSSFGPDLTGIPRSRYSGIKPSKGQGGPKKLSSFNNFVKIKSHEGEKKDFKEIAALWNKLTPEQKKEYETK